MPSGDTRVTGLSKGDARISGGTGARMGLLGRIFGGSPGALPDVAAALASTERPTLQATTKTLRAIGYSVDDAAAEAVALSTDPRGAAILGVAAHLGAQGFPGHYAVKGAVELLDTGPVAATLDVIVALRDLGWAPGSSLDRASRLVREGVATRVLDTAADLRRFGIAPIPSTTRAEQLLARPDTDQVLELARHLRDARYSPANALDAAVELEPPAVARVLELWPRLLKLDDGRYPMLDHATKLARQSSQSANHVVDVAVQLQQFGIRAPHTGGRDLITRARVAIGAGDVDERLATAARFRSAGAAPGVAHDMAIDLGAAHAAARAVDPAVVGRLREIGFTDYRSLRHAIEFIGRDDVETALRIADLGVAPPVALTMSRELIEAGIPEARIAELLARSRSTGSGFTKDTIRAAVMREHGPLEDLGRLLTEIPGGDTISVGYTLGALATRLDAQVPIDAADAALLDAARRLVDDNMARMAGTLADGYRGHPDYADLGRIASLLELSVLRDAARKAAASAPAPMTPPATSSAAGGSELLSW